MYERLTVVCLLQSSFYCSPIYHVPTRTMLPLTLYGLINIVYGVYLRISESGISIPLPVSPAPAQKTSGDDSRPPRCSPRDMTLAQFGARVFFSLSGVRAYLKLQLAL